MCCVYYMDFQLSLMRQSIESHTMPITLYEKVLAESVQDTHFPTIFHMSSQLQTHVNSYVCMHQLAIIHHMLLKLLNKCTMYCTVLVLYVPR